MDFEKPKQELADNKEQQEDAPEGSLLKKANRLLDHMNIPNKETVKKWLAGALAGTAAMTAVETQNVNGNVQEIDITKDLTPIAQKAVEASRTMMGFEKDPNTQTIATYLNIPSEKVNEGAKYVFEHEALNDDVISNYSYSKEVPMSCDNMYFIAKNALAVATEIKSDDDDTNEHVRSMFDGLKSDVRTFTFNGMEIDPVGQAQVFDGTGSTKSDAILNALEGGINFVNGVHVRAQDTLRSISGIKGSEQKFVELITDISEGFIDHYDVTSVEENENGFTVTIKMTFGERPQYQLPDGVQLADGNSQSYYEINPDDEK